MYIYIERILKCADTDCVSYSCIIIFLSDFEVLITMFQIRNKDSSRCCTPMTFTIQEDHCIVIQGHGTCKCKCQPCSHAIAAVLDWMQKGYEWVKLTPMQYTMIVHLKFINTCWRCSKGIINGRVHEDIHCVTGNLMYMYVCVTVIAAKGSRIGPQGYHWRSCNRSNC